MRSQLHNQGSLSELKVNIEEEIVTAIKNMSANTGISVDDLVVIALKRYRSAHTDYEKLSPEYE